MAAEGLAQSPGHGNLGGGGEPEVLERPAASFPEDADAVGVVEAKNPSVGLDFFDESGQRGDLAEGRKNAVGQDRRPLALLEDGFQFPAEVGRVEVFIAGGPFARGGDAVPKTIVRRLVDEGDIERPGMSLGQEEAVEISRGIIDGLGGAEERGQFFLDVEKGGVVPEPRARRGAVRAVAESGHPCPDNGGVAVKAEIAGPSEIDAGASIDDRFGARGAAHEERHLPPGGAWFHERGPS